MQVQQLIPDSRGVGIIVRGEPISTEGVTDGTAQILVVAWPLCSCPNVLNPPAIRLSISCWAGRQSTLIPKEQDAHRVTDQEHAVLWP
jgi:hypothetical protein